jgi:SAM-dependent methyltransferase
VARVGAVGGQTPDDVNRPVWELPETIAGMSVEGFTDAGERDALLALAAEWRGRPLLDIGIGSGRTTTLLRLLSDDYIGVDYTAAMVAAAQRNHPGVDIRLGDARDLTEQPDRSRAGVVFSYNGIDALDRDDRRRALAEMARVVTDDGAVLFSTLNKAGPDWRQPPWRAAPPPWVNGSLQPYGGRGAARVVRTMLRAARSPGSRVRGYRNWWCGRRLVIDRGGWGIGVLAAHEYGLLTHFVRLDQQVADLETCGLRLDAAYAAEDGRRLAPGDDLSGVRWFQIIARPAR